MHEMSIAESILQIIEESGRSEGFSSVRTVRLEIGQLAGIEPEALLFCFDAVTRDSIAQDARLEITQTPGRGWCLECSSAVAVSARYEPCPSCGSSRIRVTDGDQMRVIELEAI